MPIRRSVEHHEWVAVSTPQRARRYTNMLVIGHRGAAGTSPENTLVAIRDGLSAGADWLEIDVRQVDDQLLVIHDETLERTTSGTGNIYEQPLETLRALDAGRGEQIPFLHEVIDEMNAVIGLNVELKDCASLDRVLETLDEALRRQPLWRGRLMVSSFEQGIHSDLARRRPDGCLFGLLNQKIFDGLIDYALSLRAYSLNLSFKQLDRSLLERAHAAGLRVFVYTVNEARDIERCIGLNVDGIYTDYPARTIAFLHDRNMIL